MLRNGDLAAVETAERVGGAHDDVAGLGATMSFGHLCIGIISIIRR